MSVGHKNMKECRIDEECCDIKHVGFKIKGGLRARDYKGG